MCPASGREASGLESPRRQPLFAFEMRLRSRLDREASTAEWHVNSASLIASQWSELPVELKLRANHPSHRTGMNELSIQQYHYHETNIITQRCHSSAQQQSAAAKPTDGRGFDEGQHKVMVVRAVTKRSQRMCQRSVDAKVLLQVLQLLIWETLQSVCRVSKNEWWVLLVNCVLVQHDIWVTQWGRGYASPRVRQSHCPAPPRWGN